MPGLQGSQLAQFGALNQSGLQQLGLDQTNIDAAIQRFFFEQNAAYNALSQFQNFIGGSFGSSVGGDPNYLNFPGLDTDILDGGGKDALVVPGFPPPGGPPPAPPGGVPPPPGSVPPVGPPPSFPPPLQIPPVGGDVFGGGGGTDKGPVVPPAGIAPISPQLLPPTPRAPLVPPTALPL